jgi:hypothetical protein
MRTSHHTITASGSEVSRHPVQAIERKAHHLHEVERLGESAETPLIAILGLVLFFACAFAIMTGLSFAAYYLAR